jgi:nucleotide-binding universal stress UspA family protein
MDRIRNIIVATDFSPLSDSAGRRAATLATLDGATIHLVHAVRYPAVATPYEVSVPAGVWEGVRRGAEEKLEESRKALEKEAGATVTAEVSDATDPARAIAEAVEAHAADLIVMGTHGHSGIKHAFLGSVAERTLRTAPCPVLAVKESGPTAAAPISRILVAMDFSPHAEEAAQVATRLAKRLSASVDVLHVFDLPRDYIPYASVFGTELEQKVESGVAEKLESVRERLEATDVPVTLHYRRGHPSVVIADTAEQSGCQLIVMGTRGQTGLSHVLLGSVAERTLRAAPCSVLVVKAETDEA